MRLLVCVVTALSFSLASTVRADIVYTVAPVALSGGYNVSGFIETDGTLGVLSPTDVLDYQIDVSGGALPFTFLPTQPGALLLLDGGGDESGLIATESALTLVDNNPGGAQVLLRIWSSVSPALGCGGAQADCRQKFEWQLFDPPLSGDGTGVYVSYTLDNVNASGAGVVSSASFPAPLSIVVATVPEPSTFVSLGMVGLGILGNRRLQRVFRTRE